MRKYFVPHEKWKKKDWSRAEDFRDFPATDSRPACFKVDAAAAEFRAAPMTFPFSFITRLMITISFALIAP